MAQLTMAAGVFAILIGTMSWIGLLPAKERTSYFSGGVKGELVIMGAGLIVLGVGGFYHWLGVGLVGLAIVVVGFVLGVIAPAWMLPRWYKERFSSR
jgi:hypothetical protein